jgi:hypothetical protein
MPAAAATLSLLSPPPARQTLAGTMPPDSPHHFILMRYADGTGAVGGPWTKSQAQRRAAMLYQVVPATVSVQVVDRPLPPIADADASRRYMAVASYLGDDPGPSRRIVFGWWASPQEAHDAAAAILDSAPDASSADYEIRAGQAPGDDGEGPAATRSR